MSVGRYVGRSVEGMVSADYLENHLSQSLNISHVDWSSPIAFWSLGQISSLQWH